MRKWEIHLNCLKGITSFWNLSLWHSYWYSVNRTLSSIHKGELFRLSKLEIKFNGWITNSENSQVAVYWNQQQLSISQPDRAIMPTPSTCSYMGQGGGVASVYPETEGQGHWSSSTLTSHWWLLGPLALQSIWRRLLYIDRYIST